MHSLLFIILPPVVPIHTPPNPTAPTTHPHPPRGGGVGWWGLGWGGVGGGGRRREKGGGRTERYQIESANRVLRSSPYRASAARGRADSARLRGILETNQNQPMQKPTNTTPRPVAVRLGGALLNSNMNTHDKLPHGDVDHPEHYNRHPSGVECITIAEGFNFNLGNAIKYIWRAGLKGDAITDLQKAEHYIAREIGRLAAERIADDAVQLVRIDDGEGDLK